MEEGTMLANFCWFFGGILIYKFLSHILGLSKAMRLYLETMGMALKLVKAMDENYENILQLKYNTQKTNDIEDEVIETQKHMDVVFQNLWRHTMINTIITFCPKELKGALRFNNWDTAMKLLNKRDKS